MSIQTTPQITDKDREQAKAFAEGLRQLAAFVEASPEFADRIVWQFERVNVPVTTAEDPKGMIADFARAALRSGAVIEKDFGDQYAGVNISFGSVGLYVYSFRADVCERVVVGTEEVTKEVPDPEALASVPKVTVTETVEKVEWRCHPLLAEAVDDDAEQAAA